MKFHLKLLGNKLINFAVACDILYNKRKNQCKNLNLNLFFDINGYMDIRYMDGYMDI